MKKMQAKRTSKNGKKTAVKLASRKKAHRMPKDGNVDKTGNKGPDKHREAPHRRPRKNRTDTESRPKEHRMHTEPKTGIRYGSVDVTGA